MFGIYWAVLGSAHENLRAIRRACVCGVGVCNEPATSVPAGVLRKYYEAATETVRLAGMRAGEVTVLLPIFTELRTSDFLDLWEANYPKYEDTACVAICRSSLALSSLEVALRSNTPGERGRGHGDRRTLCFVCELHLHHP